MTNEIFKRNDHPDAQWFPDAGLGLFLHWGISSVHGGIEISWGMVKNTPWDKPLENWNKITPNEYFKLADRFAPALYNPDKWLRAAADAGFRYAVLTTRHHDGYAMWPSVYGDFGTSTHMGGRDLVGPFVEACRANGLKVGLYYSPPDWYFSRHHMSFNYSGDILGLDHEQIGTLPERPEEFDSDLNRHISGQVDELLTRYGKIDVLWFDGVAPDAIPFSRFREMQPGMVVNERMHGFGDFSTAECKMPETRLQGWWEMCDMFTMNAWGYTDTEQYHSTEFMFSRFIKARGWGGNYLLNAAPRPDGEMPAIFYERMKEWKEKMKDFNTQR